MTGVASAAKLDFVTSLGAAAVVDYTNTKVADLDERFDLIIDVGGRTPLRQIRRVLAERGALVIVGGEDGGRFTGGIGRNLRAVAWSMFIKQRMTFFISSESRTYIDPLVEMLAAGDVVAAIGQQVTLDNAPEAIRVIGEGGGVGKTVIAGT